MLHLIWLELFVISTKQIKINAGAKVNIITKSRILICDDDGSLMLKVTTVLLSSALNKDVVIFDSQHIGLDNDTAAQRLINNIAGAITNQPTGMSCFAEKHGLISRQIILIDRGLENGGNHKYPARTKL